MSPVSKLRQYHNLSTTDALGIDKSNVRWIVHGDLPRSVEAYYQETGRAARDGEPADTVMFFGPIDIQKIRYHIDRMESDEEHPGDCGNCDVCTGVVEREDLSVAAQKILSAAHRTGQRFGGHYLADIVTGAATDRILELGHNELPTFGVGERKLEQYGELFLSLVTHYLDGGGCAES